MPSFKVELVADIPEQARAWRNDPSIWKWCRQNAPISEGDHARWLASLPGNQRIKMFGIAVNGVPVGVCGLTSIDRLNQSAEFSLYIAAEHQHQGYGGAALAELLHHAFMNENLNRVWGESFGGNPALKMFSSMGLAVEGRARSAYYREGQFIDAVQVSILRSEYVTGLVVPTVPYAGGVRVHGNFDPQDISFRQRLDGTEIHTK